MDRDQRCLGFMEISEGAAICPHYGWRRDSAATSPPYMPPGTVLQDQYLVGRALGQAGSGFTYLAWDQTLARKVELQEFFRKGLRRGCPARLRRRERDRNRFFCRVSKNSGRKIPRLSRRRIRLEPMAAATL
jgi:hypothetical protein